MSNIHWLQDQKIARLILWMSVIVLQMLNPVTSLEDRPSTWLWSLLHQQVCCAVVIWLVAISCTMLRYYCIDGCYCWICWWSLGTIQEDWCMSVPHPKVSFISWYICYVCFWSDHQQRLPCGNVCFCHLCFTIHYCSCAVFRLMSRSSLIWQTMVDQISALVLRCKEKLYKLIRAVTLTRNCVYI